MDSLQWYDYLRLATAALCFSAFVFSALRAKQRWSSYTERDRDYWWAFNALLLLMVEGSIESIFKSLEWGPRTLLAFLIAIVCLRASSRGAPENLNDKEQDDPPTISEGISWFGAIFRR